MLMSSSLRRLVVVLMLCDLLDLCCGAGYTQFPASYPHLKKFKSALVSDMSKGWMENVVTNQEVWLVALTHGVEVDDSQCHTQFHSLCSEDSGRSSAAKAPSLLNAASLLKNVARATVVDASEAPGSKVIPSFSCSTIVKRCSLSARENSRIEAVPIPVPPVSMGTCEHKP